MSTTIQGYVFDPDTRRTLTFTAMSGTNDTIDCITEYEGEEAEAVTMLPDHPIHPYLSELMASLHEAEHAASDGTARKDATS